MPYKYNRFQFFLYQIFLQEKRHDAQDVARKLGIPPSTLYHWIEGENAFPIDMLAPLYNATQDIDFLNFVLNDTDKKIIDKAPAAKQVKTPTDETLDIAAATGALVAEVKRTLKDGYLSANDKRALEKQINIAEKEIEDLRKVLKDN